MRSNLLTRRRAVVTLVAAVAVPLLTLGGQRLHRELCKRFVYTRWFDDVVPGRLYRGSQLNDASWDRIGRHGVRTIIDLRVPIETPESYEAELRRVLHAGLRLVRIPISAAAPSDGQVAEFLSLVRADTGPVLVHCQHGRSRTGMMAAAYRVIVQNWTSADAVREMRRYGWATTGARADEWVAMLERLEHDRAYWLAQTAAPNAERRAPCQG